MAHISKVLAHKTVDFPKRDETKYIVVHCADTPAKMDVGVCDIRRWHLERGWKDIGYHYVIRRSGLIEAGRHFSAVGAHVEGYNRVSIGICLVGRETNYTPEQWQALSRALMSLTHYYKGASVLGHCDLDPLKKRHCPGFSVKKWWAAQNASMKDIGRAQNVA